MCCWGKQGHGSVVWGPSRVIWVLFFCFFFAGSVCLCLLMWCTHGWTAQTWLYWRNWRRSKSKWRRNRELWGSCGSIFCADIGGNTRLQLNINLLFQRRKRHRMQTLSSAFSFSPECIQNLRTSLESFHSDGLFRHCPRGKGSLRPKVRIFLEEKKFN